jgi:hypothetical protein
LCRLAAALPPLLASACCSSSALGSKVTASEPCSGWRWQGWR